MSGTIGANLVSGRSSGLISVVEAAGGGAWNLIGTAVASDDASLTVTGLNSTYDTFAIAGSDLKPASDGSSLELQLGDSSGIDVGSNDYFWHRSNLNNDSASYNAQDSQPYGHASIDLIQDMGNSTGEGGGFLVFLHQPGDATNKPVLSGTGCANENNPGRMGGAIIFGRRDAVITVDRVNIFMASGNLTSGRLTVWGIAHA